MTMPNRFAIAATALAILLVAAHAPAPIDWVMVAARAASRVRASRRESGMGRAKEKGIRVTRQNFTSLQN